MLLVNERSGRAAVQVPAPSLMLDDGEVERRVRLIRPMEAPQRPADDDAGNAIGSKPTARPSPRAWAAELAEVPEFTDSKIHIVAGLLLPIWKRLPNESTRVYRLQTDAGERIVGRKVSPAWVAGALETGPSTLSPDDAFAALMDGRTILDLAEGLQLRRVRVMGANRIELTGFTDTMRDRLGPMASSMRSSRGSSGCSCRPTPRAGDPGEGAGALPDRARRRPGGRVTMTRDAAELAHRLARDAEAVCRHYLSNGRREGRYWLVGDVRNTPGRSLFVRLKGPESGKGAAGKWTDAATGEHGDLLDVIRETCGLVDFHDVADEARRFLALPRPEPEPAPVRLPPTGSPESARRLFAMAQPITGTIVEAYLRRRGITALHGTGTLRFHPRCYYRPDRHSPTETWPAMIAAVTDLDGKITGAHRTWLDPSGRDKAPIDTPRRAMGASPRQRRPLRCGGRCHGGRRRHRNHAVAAMRHAHHADGRRRSRPRISPPSCSRLRCAGSISPATTIRPATAAVATLVDRAQRPGSRRSLSPALGDFNEDLRRLGVDALRAALRVQIAPEDVARFMDRAIGRGGRCARLRTPPIAPDPR